MKHFVYGLFQHNDGVLVQGLTLIDHADLAVGHVFQLRQWVAEVSPEKAVVKNLDVILLVNLDGLMPLSGDGSAEDAVAKAFWR